MKLRIISSLLLAIGMVQAYAYDYNGTPVGSWLTAHTTSQIKQAISQGWRPTSIELEALAGNNGIYRVNYIQNVGSHYLQCRFEGEQTSAQIDAIRNAGWRIEDVSVVGSKLAGIFIKNTTLPKTTLYFYGWTSSQIQTWLNGNSTYRVLDLDRYTASSTTKYSGVFLKNTGNGFTSAWGWHPSMTWDQVGNYASANSLRVIDLDRQDSGNYAVVFAKRESGQRYFYFGNRTMAQVLDFLGNRGLRVQTISTTMDNGTARYSGSAVNNVNAQSARLADYAAGLHNGIQGYYVKEIGGATLANIQATRSMHPSSTIKVLLHFTGVNDTATNALGTKKLSGIPMQQVHSKMMWNSDNTMANLCLDTYGELHSEAIGHTLAGMSDVTNFRNRFGTGGPYGNPQITTTTLVDLGNLYTTVENGFFNSTKDTWFRSNMLNNSNSNLFGTVLANIKSQIGITTSKYNSWLSKLRYIYKAGSNSDSNNINGYWSIAGSISLPIKSGDVYLTKKYVFGHYVNASTISYAGGSAAAETMREQIKASMLTFK